MDIEEVAAHTPEKIHKVFHRPGQGPQPIEPTRRAQDRRARCIRASGALDPAALYRAFWDTDASLAEINP